MALGRLLLVFLMIAVTTRAWSHHRHAYRAENGKPSESHRSILRSSEEVFPVEQENEAIADPKVSDRNWRSPNGKDGRGAASVPFSARRLEKMLEKAIFKIITGDLNPADMLLLKSLNYSLEEVLAIRARELNERVDPTGEEARKESNLVYGKSSATTTSTTTTTKKKETRLDYAPPSNSYDEKQSLDSDDDQSIRRDKSPRKSSPYDEDFDFDAYNRQAVIDYENLAAKMELQQSWSNRGSPDYEEAARISKEKSSAENLRRHFDRAMEPHVVFKIRYDDSEFDSSSDETAKMAGKERASGSRTSRHRGSSTLRNELTASSSNTGNSFHASSYPSSSSSSSHPSVSSSASRRTSLPVVHRTTETLGSLALDTSASIVATNKTKNEEGSSSALLGALAAAAASAAALPSIGVPADPREASERKVNEYEGLEWIEDDVYRVIPSVVDSLGYDDNDENDDENESSEYDDSASGYYRRNSSGLLTYPNVSESDISEYQSDTPDSVTHFAANANFSADNAALANLSTYQQLALAHRRHQGQKAIEDIKSRVLALTGRFNLSANSNQVQRERLTMFSPTCQVPRNTDPEAWTDPFSMNMYFQLNLSSGDHVVAAKLRIFQLPQENLTSSMGSTFEEDEKKIRISIYYYTKSLKMHRSKKRLMDSVVTPLTSDGTHLALDVRQGLRFWRLNPRNQHGNGSNHGLVIQVEDQEGRPLKPALYIQQPSCSDHDSDQKTGAYLHFSFEPAPVTIAS